MSTNFCSFLLHKRKGFIYLMFVHVLALHSMNPVYSMGKITASTLDLYKPGNHVWAHGVANSTIYNYNTTGIGIELNKDPKPIVISLKVVQNVMQYDKKILTVKAGQKVTINFENPDFMQHNLVIIKPGATEKVGAAIDLLASDPNGAKMNYIPKLKEVLFSTKLLAPQEKISLQFTAPAQPGDYPFICTFPGHWRIMNGVMKVTK